MNIKRLYEEEIREKKKIGRNIFSRSATRKGGVKQPLRTPYLYMNNKERKKLNGDVEVFNMNDIISYHELKKRPKEEQKMLLENWRSRYKADKIIEEMDISHNTYYKLVNKLGISKREIIRNQLSEDELNKYLSQPDHYMSFDLFKSLDRSQQYIIFNKYMENHDSIQSLANNWENCSTDYLYNARHYFKRQGIAKKLEESPQPKKTNQKDNDKTINAKINKADKLNHSSNISANGKTFNFELNGEYSADAIIRRLNILIEEIKDSEEKLNIDIKITN